MDKSKMKSSKTAMFAKAGGKKMAGKSGAAPAMPGGVSVGGRANAAKAAKAGGKKMAGFTPAMASKPR